MTKTETPMNQKLETQTQNLNAESTTIQSKSTLEKSKLETNLLETEITNSDLFELAVDNEIRKKAPEMEFENIIDTVQEKEDLSEFAHKRHTKVPDYLKVFFAKHDIKPKQRYEYFESKYKVDDFLYQGLMGMYYPNTDRIVTFPTQSALVAQTQKMNSLKYAQMKEGILYNELMHKILYQEVLDPEHKIEFRPLTDKEKRDQKNMMWITNPMVPGLLTWTTRRRFMKENNMNKAEFNDMIQVLQEYELLSDYSSIMHDHNDVKRISEFSWYAKVFRNQYSGYNLTVKVMGETIEELQTKAKNEGRKFSIENLTEDEIAHITNVYEAKSDDIIKRWKTIKQDPNHIINKMAKMIMHRHEQKIREANRTKTSAK